MSGEGSAPFNSDGGRSKSVICPECGLPHYPQVAYDLGRCMGCAKTFSGVDE